MDWNSDKQHELEAFLTRFTSPDAAAQQLNLVQMDALAHEAGAMQALLGILTVTATRSPASVYTAAQRAAASTTARQLIRVNPSFLDITDLHAAGKGLFAALLAESNRTVQNSLCSLVASLVCAETMRRRQTAAHPPSPGETPVFLTALVTDLTQTASSVLAYLSTTARPPEEDVLAAQLVLVRAALRVVRILAEDNVTSVLRGGTKVQVVDAVCTALAAALAVLTSCVSVPSCYEVSSTDDPFAALCVQTLDCLTACVAAELLTFASVAPLTTQTTLASGSVSTTASTLTEGHVWDAMLTVLSSVVLPQAARCLSAENPLAFTVSATLLRPVWALTSACVSATSLSSHVLAPLVALTVPAVQSFWSACCARQRDARAEEADLVDEDAITAALLGAIACVADIVTHVGVDAAVLPSMVSHIHALAQLSLPLAVTLMSSHECNQPSADDPSTVLAVLQRRQEKSRRQVHKADGNARCDDGASREAAAETEMWSARDEGDDTDDGHDATWSGFDILLPDQGARRQALGWLLNCLAFACPSSLTATLVAPMVHLICQTELLPTCASGTSPGDVSAALRVEAALFVLSEVTEELLAVWDDQKPSQDSGKSALLIEMGRAAEHVTNLLNRFLTSPASHVPSASAASLLSCRCGVPFFLRVACCRWLARFLSGAEQVLLSSTTSSPPTVATVWQLIGSLGGVPNALEALRLLASAESSKSAQQECLHAMDIILCGALRRSPDDMAVPMANSGGVGDGTDDETITDSDDEILDDVDDRRGTASLAFQLGLLSTSTQSPSPLFALLCALTQDLLIGEHPRGALATRLDLYSLLSRVLPLLEASLELPGGAQCVTTLLETVAQRYMSLQSLATTSRMGGSGAPHAELIVVESVSILNCLCDVGASVGPFLAPACTWIVQVCGSVLLDEWRGTRAGVYQQSVVTNAADRCMLALDLLSCACDALLDRDAMVCLSTVTPSSGNERQTAHAIVGTLTSLRSAFSHSQDGHTLLSLTVGVVRQALARKPSVDDHAGALEDTLGSDVEADLRRAAFSVLYDLVFLFSTETHETCGGAGGGGVARVEMAVPLTESHVATCAALVELCLGELDGVVRLAESGQSVVSYVANSSALSNAMLCLGETLFFLTAATADSAASTATMTATESERHRLTVPVVVRSLAPLAPNCHRLLMALVRLLMDRNLFAVPVSVSQNAASAVAALACVLQVLAQSDACASACVMTSEGLCGVIRAIATELKHFKPTREHEGAFECCQLLVCLGRALAADVAAVLHTDGMAPSLGACLTLVLDGISGAGGVQTTGGHMIQQSWQHVMPRIAQSRVPWGKALSLAKQKRLGSLFSTS